MKPRDGATEYSLRKSGGSLLKEDIDTTPSDDEVIVMGDFNDELTRSIRLGITSPHEAWVTDSGRYRFLTLQIEQRLEGTSFPFGSTTDQIVVNQTMEAGYVEESVSSFSELFSVFPDTHRLHLITFQCTPVSKWLW